MRIKQLPEWLQELAIANIDAQKGLGTANMESDINDRMSWSSTPEGSEFWREVNGGNFPPEPDEYKVKVAKKATDPVCNKCGNADVQDDKFCERCEAYTDIITYAEFKKLPPPEPKSKASSKGIYEQIRQTAYTGTLPSSITYEEYTRMMSSKPKRTTKIPTEKKKAEPIDSIKSVNDKVKESIGFFYPTYPQVPPPLTRESDDFLISSEPGTPW